MCPSLPGSISAPKPRGRPVYEADTKDSAARRKNTVVAEARPHASCVRKFLAKVVLTTIFSTLLLMSENVG